MGTLPNACTASVWMIAPADLANATSSGIGCTTPVSLLTHITVTIAVSLPIASRASSRSTTPDGNTRSMRSTPPSIAAWCTAPSTALCSMGDVTMVWRAPVRMVRQPPSTARLSDSVPPEVMTTSSTCAPKQRATRSRASSSAARASRPQRCVDDGFPKRGPKNGSIAAKTSGRTGVVAAWSR